MRPEIRWALASAAALAVGVIGAVPYARLAAPYYAFVDSLLAAHHPWEISRVDVKPGKSSLGAELQLEGYVRRRMNSREHAARVVGRVQVGEVVESPLVFWTLLLAWPARSTRRRALRCAIGVPVFLALEAITTATQLLLPMAQASALLAGDRDPVTDWDHWSRFLEFGGQFALAAAAAIVVASMTQRAPRSMAYGHAEKLTQN